MRTPRLKTHLLSLFSLSLFLAPGLQAADAGNAGSKSGESGGPYSQTVKDGYKALPEILF